MRSQKEILDKITILEKDWNDPMGVQRRHLIRKLEWINAVKWIDPAKIDNDEFKNEWKLTSRLDENYLKTEMYDFMFAAYDAWLEEDPVKCLIFCQYYIIWIWLMGPKEDSFLKHIFSIFINTENNMGRDLFDSVCKHYDWNIKVFMRKFEEKERTKPRIIIPDSMN